MDQFSSLSRGVHDLVALSIPLVSDGMSHSAVVHCSTDAESSLQPGSPMDTSVLRPTPDGQVSILSPRATTESIQVYHTYTCNYSVHAYVIIEV